MPNFKMYKKAEELSLQTIIVFIVVVIVLIVLVVIFRGQFGSISNFFSNIVKSITGSGNLTENLISK